MARAQRVLRWILGGVAVLLVLLAAAALVLTRTDFGVGQAGRLAVGQLRGMVHGDLRVGAVTSEGLLRGVTLRDVAIDDTLGRPFIRVDSARLSYRFRTLVGGDLAFDRLTLYSPEIYIERLPGQDRWNYQMVFPGDTMAPDTAAGPPTRLVSIDDITITDATVVVRMPWELTAPVQPSDTARLILEDVPGGTVRTIRVENLNARVPRVVWESPDQRGHLIQVKDMSGRLYVWETPAEVRGLEGTIALQDSVLTFDLPRVELPGSRLSAVGRMVMGDEGRSYDFHASTDHIAFSDLRWIYPPLPADGGGKLEFRLQTRGPGSTLFLLRNADIRAGDTHLAGSFGILTGDTLRFTDVDLRASPLDIDLLRSIIPGEIPLDGLLIGTIEVQGPVSALETRGNMKFLAAGGDREGSSVRWNGRVRAREPYGASGLNATVERLELAQLANVVPAIRVRGVASGRFSADGSLARGLALDGEATLRRSGDVSRFRGGGRMRLTGARPALDLRLEAAPVALGILDEQFPTLLPMAGEATGVITLRGPLDSLELGADLQTSAGRVAVTGHGSLQGESPRYAMRGEVTDFSLERLVPSLPETRVTATFQLDGVGSGLGDAQASLFVDVASARVAGVPVYRAVGSARVDHGLALVDSFAVRSAVGDASARGSFGLTQGRAGELELTVRADSVEPLELAFFPDPVEHPVGEPLERRLAGRLTVDATARGGLDSWSVQGRGSGERILYDDVHIRRASAEFEGAPDDFTLRAAVDSLLAAGRSVPAAAGTLRYTRGSGDVSLRATGADSQQVEVSGAFQRTPGGMRLQLHRLAVGLKSGRWALADTVMASVGRRGVEVDSLVLERSPVPARIRVAGVLPWREPETADTLPASLVIELDRVRVGEILRLTQTDSIVDGVVTGEFRVTGTARSPEIRGWLASRPFRYAGAVLDSAGGEMRYSGRLVTAHLAGWRDGEDVVRADASIPADLTLMSTQQRVLDLPLDVRIRADSVPAGLLSFLTPGFTGLDGRVDAAIDMMGTARSPELQGELRLSDGSAFFEPLLVRYHGVQALARMRPERRVELTATLRTEEGSADVKGLLDLTHPADPGFDLDVNARRFEASRRRDVAAVADGVLHVGGRYHRPVVSGDLRLVRAEMNLDEIWRRYQIVQLDTSMLQLFDTATVTYRPSPPNPFLKNLVVTDLNLNASREMWLRSRELDVEVSGSLEVEADLGAGDLRLTGPLQTVRGTYDLRVAQRVPARRFDINSGTIEFVGTPGIDPNLNVEAAYRVRRAEGDPIDVVAVLTGTLQDPRVRLTTNSDLQVSQADLASYLLFGRSGAELTQSESDVLSTGVMTGLGLGLLRPALTGFASSELQRVASSLLGIDYLALRAPEYQLGDYSSYGLLGNTQVELGVDATRDVTLILSGRIPAQQESWSPRLFGARVQYRFRPTWTGEFYLEDRFARTPSFGLAEIDDRKVWGLSLLRDWGY